jgi:uncharacterized protein YraI
MNGGADAVCAVRRRAVVLAVVFLVAAWAVQPARAASKLRVTADRVNLRASPGADSEVVTQCARGDVLTATETRGEWVRVAAPASADVWVYEELTENGTVVAPSTQVRSGPGINYTVLCTVPKGTSLTVRGSRVGWLQVAPLDGCYLWVSAQYTEPADKPPAAPPPARPAQEAPKPPPSAPASPSVVEVTPPPPIGPPPVPPSPASRFGVLKLPAPAPRRAAAVRAAPQQPEQPAVEPRQAAQPAAETKPPEQPVAAPAPAQVAAAPAADASQGALVIRSGVLSLAAWVWHRPAKYRLVQEDRNGYAVTVCYVAGSDATLAPLVGARLVIHGRESVVRGVRHPLLVPEHIARE